MGGVGARRVSYLLNSVWTRSTAISGTFRQRQHLRAARLGDRKVDEQTGVPFAQKARFRVPVVFSSGARYISLTSGAIVPW